MKISASISPTEHWLTLLNCAICKRTPETSPVYKCNYGHTVCYACFQNLVNDEAIPVCNECGSEQFTRHDVSDDFLRKLKTKPGIGRPCRYELKPDQPDRPTPDPSDLVTVEELFNLPAQKIQQLFEDCTKEKLCYLKKLSATECLPGKLANRNSNRNSADKVPFEKTYEALQSRKPLRCPHDTCNKIVAISSFKAHFKYEHFDFKRYHTTRGNELCIPFDPAVLQHGKSTCLGIVSLVRLDEDLRTLRSTDDNFSFTYDPCGGVADDGEIDSFWLMTSGSQNDHPSQAFVMLWLFTNNEEVDYHCTLELTSEENVMTMTTFCKVNKIYESQSVDEVARNENCLYMAYATVRSMLVYGPALTFRLIIH